MDRTKSTSWINFIKDWYLPLQIWLIFLFSCEICEWVEKCYIGLPEKLPKWHYPFSSWCVIVCLEPFNSNWPQHTVVWDIKGAKCSLRCSTSVLVFDCWLMTRMISLKLCQKMLQSPAEKIIFFCLNWSDWKKNTYFFLICSAFHKSYLF